MGVGTSIPPLQSDGGAFVSDPADKADALSNFFDGKQSRNVINRSASCHRKTKLDSFVFRSQEVRRLLSEFDIHDGADPLKLFPLFSRNWHLFLHLSSVWC